uniref:Uncharacterized protein n=2 Tax=Meloidogyne enterolobii TaxID=390850 RepID=A0A6V7XFX3_MELEN|nr:unnamed protein product [Meloidogyne enterolobii]
MKTYIYLLFINLLLIIFVIIPIKCASQKNDKPDEVNKISDPGASSSSFTQRRYLNPTANEFNPREDIVRYHSSSFDELAFKQFLSIGWLNPTILQTPNLWNFPNYSEFAWNQPEKRFITEFNPEGIMSKISQHFDEFGWPEEERVLIEDKHLMGINLLSKKANWILEIVSHSSDEITEDIVTKKYQKFGYYDDKKMLKTLELLDRYASCVAKWNKRNIITITGPITVLSDACSEKTVKKGSVKRYPFNNKVKHPPITQVFKVIIIEYERRKYCAEIIFTDWTADNWNAVINYADISKENCGKKHLDNWKYKNYIKDYKIMGELFKNRLEFLEWYIGFELIDLLHISGFDKIKKLGTCIY